MLKKFSGVKKLVAGGIVLVLVAGGWYLYGSRQGETKTTTVTETPVKQGDLKLSWKTDGSAVRDSEYLDFAVGGVLKNLYVKLGDTVTVGQQLAEIEPETYASALKNAEINYRKALAVYTSTKNSRELSLLDERLKLESARQAYEKASAEYLPMTGLSGVYSDQELALARIAYETAKASYDAQSARIKIVEGNNSDIESQKAGLDAAEIALKQAQEDLADTVLKAKGAGRIMGISGVAGAYVRSGDDASTSGDGHFLTLAPDESVQVAVDVQETDYGKLSVGQSALVTFEASEGVEYPAEVTEVSLIPTVDSNGVVTYSATLVLNGEAPEIQTGMSCTVEFIQKEAPGVLIIPNKAVYITDRKQMVKVKTSEGGFEERVIKTGFTDGTQAEVSSGLQLGDTVLVESVGTGAK